MANEALNLKVVNGRPKSSPSTCGKPQFAFDFYPTKTVYLASRVRVTQWQAGQVPLLWGSTQVLSQLPATPVCVIMGWVPPNPLGNCELSRKEGKVKAKG